MVKRSTWIWFVILLAAIGAFLYLKYRPSPPVEATPTPVASEYLFGEADGTLVGIRISDRQNHIVELIRPTGGLWSISLPQPGPATQSIAEAGAVQVNALLVVNRLEQPQSLVSLGLEFPAYLLKFTFTDSGQHILEVGNITASGRGYYVKMDGGDIIMISPDGIEPLLNLLTAPPYLPSTSTPVPVQVGDTPTP